MNAKISVFVFFVEEIIYLLLHNLHDCTFKHCLGKGTAAHPPFLLLIDFRILNI